MSASRDHFRKYPVKFVSFKDFRFQDIKDFSNDLRDFKLVADPSGFSGKEGRYTTTTKYAMFKRTCNRLYTNSLTFELLTACCNSDIKFGLFLVNCASSL